MAKMRNISIKAIKEFEGMEELALQGNLYIGNKKVAFWSQDGNGAIEDRLVMEPGYSERKLRALFSEDGEGIDVGFEKFMSNLAVLALEEKDFKKQAKKGNGVMIRKSTDSWFGELFIPTEYASCSDERVVETFREEIRKVRVYARRGEVPKIEVIRSLEDFNIPGDEVKPEDIAEGGE